MGKLCQNRTVIITGAGGGLGRAHALAFAAEGANVIVNDINVEAATEVVEAITANGGVGSVDNFDITDYAASGAAVQRAIDTYGELHVVLNNAGNNRDRMFTSLSEEDWDAVIAVHLKGHFCLSQHAAKHWRMQAKEEKLSVAESLIPAPERAYRGRLVKVITARPRQGSQL